MTSTIVKVDSSVRDRLAVLARDRGTTMGAPLAEATEGLEREAFFANARTQLERLRREHPPAWDDDRDEASWLRGTGRDTLSSRDDDGWWGA